VSNAAWGLTDIAAADSSLSSRRNGNYKLCAEREKKESSGIRFLAEAIVMRRWCVVEEIKGWEL
jgi:hypothetical protein